MLGLRGGVRADGEGTLQTMLGLGGGVCACSAGASFCSATGLETTGGGGMTTSNVAAGGLDGVGFEYDL